MKYKLTMVATMAATLMTSPVVAKELIMGTGGPAGNYFGLGTDINEYCAEDVTNFDLNVVNSGGSVDNLLGITNKKYALGMVQEDVLNFHAKRSPKQVNKNRVKVLVGLHEEAVHLLIPKNYKPKTDSNTGMWNKWFGASEQNAKKFELSMLKGQEVGSWGGSMVSAQALSYFFGLNLNVVETSNNANDLSKPLVLVGGAPYAVVDEYLKSGKWTLAALDHDSISQTAGFYSKQNVNYQIGGKVQSVETVGVRALLVGKSFRKKTRNASMTELATCIYANVADLADDPNTNPNWSSVYDYIEDEGQSDWSYFPLDEDKLDEYL
ncbi:TAXI family TRAP transporter solute-binding subunit [Enterovibrio norvegicus]|uniref:TAXI family TRAP transporter solute-binding subunit n=1 Tax=Enterovibrio norvegicus TaxID=188144 RepID=UPI00352C371C